MPFWWRFFLLRAWFLNDALSQRDLMQILFITSMPCKPNLAVGFDPDPRWHPLGRPPPEEVDKCVVQSIGIDLVPRIRMELRHDRRRFWILARVLPRDSALPCRRFRYVQLVQWSSSDRDPRTRRIDSPPKRYRCSRSGSSSGRDPGGRKVTSFLFLFVDGIPIAFAFDSFMISFRASVVSRLVLKSSARTPFGRNAKTR